MLIRFQKILLVPLVVGGWFALVAQFYLIIMNRDAPVFETVIRYFSFFTILTNILVAICCTFLLLKSSSGAAHFFSTPATLTAITVYITVVGIVYNTVLRFLWQPKGLQLVVDELLHSIIPALFILMWIFCSRKMILKWKDVFLWLLYPLLYIIFILLRGTFAAFYPYPFLNVIELGYSKVLINCIELLFVFLFFSSLFVAVTKLSKKKL